MTAGLDSDHPEPMKAVGMAGGDRQNLPEEPLGFVQAPSLMMLKGGKPFLLNGR